MHVNTSKCGHAHELYIRDIKSAIHFTEIRNFEDIKLGSKFDFIANEFRKFTVLLGVLMTSLIN